MILLRISTIVWNSCIALLIGAILVSILSFLLSFLTVIKIKKDSKKVNYFINPFHIRYVEKNDKIIGVYGEFRKDNVFYVDNTPLLCSNMKDVFPPEELMNHLDELLFVDKTAGKIYRYDSMDGKYYFYDIIRE